MSARQTTAPEAVAKTALQELQQQKHYRILISETDNKNEQQRVYVAVNGIGRWILRGVEAVVPESYVGVLKDAVKRIYVSVRDPATNEERMVSRNAQSYPFMVLGEAEGFKPSEKDAV